MNKLLKRIKFETIDCWRDWASFLFWTTAIGAVVYYKVIEFMCEQELARHIMSIPLRGE